MTMKTININLLNTGYFKHGVFVIIFVIYTRIALVLSSFIQSIALVLSSTQSIALVLSSTQSIALVLKPSINKSRSVIVVLSIKLLELPMHKVHLRSLIRFPLKKTYF